MTAPAAERPAPEAAPTAFRLKQAGWDFPRNRDDFDRFFPNDLACERYLEHLRWPEGFVCPRCGHHAPEVRRNSRGRWRCPKCDGQSSVTAGTIFQGTKTSLRKWLIGAWQMCFAKDGYSALAFQQDLGIKRYETAWLMFHKLRRAMIRPERSKLSGDVEIDECFVGGTERGRKGRAAEKKSLIMVAVELGNPPKKARRANSRTINRVRLGRIHSSSAADIVPWMLENVEEGSHIITDKNAAYIEAAKPWPEDLGGAPRYRHTFHNMTAWKKALDEHFKQRGAPEQQPPNPLPEVHRVISLFKRWLLGTHQGGVKKKNIDQYLEEFTFRFNRKRFNKDRGLIFYRLLEQAVQAPPAPLKKVMNHIEAKEVADIWWRLTEDGLHPVLTGGWAVDALLHRQTRPHLDLDLLLPYEELAAAARSLGKPRPNRAKDKRSDKSKLPPKVGIFHQVPAEPGATRLMDELGRIVDLHPIAARDDGGYDEQVADGSVFTYPAGSLETPGLLYGLGVKSVDPEVQLKRRKSIATIFERQPSVKGVIRLHGRTGEVTVRRGTAAVARRRAEEVLDLPLLEGLVAGSARIEDGERAISEAELEHLAQYEIAESQIYTARDHQEAQAEFDEPGDEEEVQE